MSNPTAPKKSIIAPPVKPKPINPKTDYFAIPLVGSALIGVALFIILNDPLQQKMGSETFKLTYQFLIIAVVGGAVSFIFSDYSKTK
jgi:hypothetical protein